MINRTLKQLLPPLVLLLAFGIQAAYLVELRAMFPNSFTAEPFCGVDAQAHLVRAAGLLDGSLPGDQPYVFIPLYPFYLATLKRGWGDSLIFPIFMQLLLQVAGLAALYGIGRLVFSPLTGLLAALGLATYNYYHFYIPCYDQALLTTPLLTLAVFFILKYHAARKSGWFPVAGIMLALATLSRPTLLLIFPTIFFWLLWIRSSLGQAIKNLLFLVLPFLIFVSPITWHNYRVSGRFILLSDNFGVNLFTGNNPDAQGLDSMAHSQSQPAVLRYIEINELVKTDKTTLPAEVIRYIIEQPGDWLALTATKIWLWFGEIDDRLVTPYFPLSVNRSRILAVLPVEWQAMAIVALLGIVLASREATSFRRLGLLWLIYAALSAVTILFFVQLRFRLPFVPFVLLSAASFLAAVPRWSQRQPRRFWIALMILLLLYPLVPGLGWFILLLLVLAQLARLKDQKPANYQVPAPACPRQTIIPYPIMGLICLYLLGAGFWIQANRLASDIAQTIDHYLGPPLAGSGILGQTFRMDCNGLHHIQISLGLLNQPHDQPATFYLATDPSGQEILFSETFDGRMVTDYQKKDFFFPPVPDSMGRTFFFFLASPTSTPENSLTARGYTDTPLDRYPEGGAWAGQLGGLQPLQADFAFKAQCKLNFWQKAQALLAF
jgi:hypothetical protein